MLYTLTKVKVYIYICTYIQVNIRKGITQEISKIFLEYRTDNDRGGKKLRGEELRRGGWE